MKKYEVFAYIYDFIHFLMDRTIDVTDIILFGSVARGEFDNLSDIDLFINTKNTKRVQKAVDAALEEFERTSKRTWMPRNIILAIKPIVGDISAPRWRALHRDIISTGILLFGKYKELPRGLMQGMIFSFRLATLKPKNRVAFIRQLYGYVTKKARKVYRHKGILEEVGGVKLNSNTIFIPAIHYRDIHNIFKKSRVPFKVREVWM